MGGRWISGVEHCRSFGALVGTCRADSRTPLEARWAASAGGPEACQTAAQAKYQIGRKDWHKLSRFRLEMQQSQIFQKNVASQGVPTSRDREPAAAKSKGKARARGRPKAGRAALCRQSLHRRDLGQIACGHGALILRNLRGQIACGNGVLILRNLRLQFQCHIQRRGPECLLPCP